MLVKKYPNLKLKIIGDGSQREYLNNLIMNNNLQNNVVLTGKLNEKEINEELLKSDIFVLTSKSESFSLVLCEAMNYGLPCVAFDVDVGPREIIKDTVTGFLIENRNVDLMISKISSLLDDNNLRYNIGQESFNNIKRFYSSSVLGMWERMFDR